MTSGTLNKKLQRAIKLHRAGDISEASTLYDQILKKTPRHAEAWHLSGLVECTRGNTQEGESRIRRALRLDPAATHFKANLAAVLVGRKELVEAEQLCRDVLRVDSRHPKALANLGTILRLKNCREEAQRIFEKAVRVNRDASALCNLATILSDLGQFNDACSLLIEARDLDPQMPEVHKNLAIVLRELNRKKEANHSLLIAERLTPDPDGLHLTKANLLLDNGQVIEAIAEYQAALQLNPESADAIFGLGCALMQVGAWTEAVEACRLATVLQPDVARFASGHLYAATMSPLLSITEVVELHRDWGARVEASTIVENLQPDLAADRALRIGYVSPDLCGHATMSFLFPLLQSHDRSKFEVVLYSESAREDQTTAMVQSLGHEWRKTRSLSDDQLVQQIRSDQIDILIDVAGHTADNRLPIFARKPAPIQVSFLGYPMTTGLGRIDYFLTDAVREPGNANRLFTETPVFLPHGAACFNAADSPELTASPHLSNGYITLGSTHRPEKISDAALRLWGQVLRQLPTARLLLFRDCLQSDSLRTQLLQRVSQAGIDPAQVDTAWDLPEKHLEVYSRFDILLDVFPWGSGTVAYDAMWMGVPLPTLAGDRSGCRAAASLMHHCGLPQLVAGSPESYVAAVTELARNSSTLQWLRQQIRPLMQQTVCDAGRFTQDVENRLLEFWQTYVDSQVV